VASSDGSSLGRLREPAVRRRLRAAIAAELLGTLRSLAVVLVFTAFMFAVGVGYYAPTAGGVPVWLWPLYADSAVAVALGGLVLLRIVPTVRAGDSVTADAPVSRPLAYLHTIAFVWLVQFGLWPLVSLNLAFAEYVAASDAWIYYWGVLGTHLLFVGLALLFPAFGRTTRGALRPRSRSSSSTSSSTTASATIRPCCTNPETCWRARRSRSASAPCGSPGGRSDGWTTVIRRNGSDTSVVDESRSAVSLSRSCLYTRARRDPRERTQ